MEVVNLFMNYPQKYVFRIKQIFNMITRINDAKTLIKHISDGFKCKFSNTAYSSNQNWNNETCQ